MSQPHLKFFNGFLYILNIKMQAPYHGLGNLAEISLTCPSNLIQSLSSTSISTLQVQCSFNPRCILRSFLLRISEHRNTCVSVLCPMLLERLTQLFPSGLSLNFTFSGRPSPDYSSQILLANLSQYSFCLCTVLFILYLFVHLSSSFFRKEHKEEQETF